MQKWIDEANVVLRISHRERKACQQALLKLPFLMCSQKAAKALTSGRPRISSLRQGAQILRNEACAYAAMMKDIAQLEHPDF
jgi:hypothetical protein